MTDKLAEHAAQADRYDFINKCKWSVPDRYEKASLNSLDSKGNANAQEAYDAIRDYAMELRKIVASGHCLLLRGNVGTGKTHALAAIVRQAYSMAITCQYVTSYDLEYYRVDPGYRADLAAVKLLAIDDLISTQKIQQAQVYEIIDRRYNRQLPTMLATNDIDLIDPRIIDRLKENGTDILMDWPSHRSS